MRWGGSLRKLGAGMIIQDLLGCLDCLLGWLARGRIARFELVGLGGSLARFRLAGWISWLRLRGVD